MSAWIFLGKQMRKTSFCVYLAARSIADTVFLLTLFVVWLDNVQVRVFHIQGVCQIVVLLSYITSFLSVWSVVFLTCDNYFRICRPHTVPVNCTTMVAYKVIASTMLFAVVLYHIPMWATSIQTREGKQRCHWLDKYSSLMQAVTYVDTFFTLVAPFIIIISLITAIMYSRLKEQKRHGRRRDISRNSKRSRSHIQKATRLVFAVLGFFLVLHTPSHVIRIKLMIIQKVHEYTELAGTDITLQRMFEVMYYLNFSVNVLIYFAAGKPFRNGLYNLVCTAHCCGEQTCCERRQRRTSMGLTITYTVVNPEQCNTHTNAHIHVQT
jgi:hypothetical protein